MSAIRDKISSMYISRAILVTVSMLLLSIPATFEKSEAASDAYTIRLGTIAPEETTWGDFAQKIKWYVVNRTRGRAKIIWYMSGVAGDETDMLDKMRHGELEGAAFTIVGLGAIEPSIRVLLMPFLLKTYEEVDFILDSMLPQFQKMFEEKGYILMGFTEVGFPHVFTQRPIRSIEDFSRFKMWSWEGEDLVQAVLGDLGFTKIFPSSLLDTRKNLEQGVVDAFYVPCYAQLGLQWYHHAKYMSDFTLGYIPAAFVMDKKYFQSLPPDIQYAIRQAFELILRPLRNVIREEEEKACQGLIRRGIMQKVQSPPELLKELERRSQQMHNKYAGKKYSREVIIDIQRKLQEFRSR